MRLAELFAVTVLLISQPVRAGVLGEVIKGLVKASGTSEDKAKAKSDDGGSDPVAEITEGLLEVVNHAMDPRSGPVFGQTYGLPPRRVAEPTQTTEATVYAGIQSVAGSDGAITMNLRVAYEDFGFLLRGTGYYESADGEDLHLDLGILGAGYRVLDGPTSLWLEAGLGGISTVAALRFFGLWAGAVLQHELAGEVAVAAEARRMAFEDDVVANELRATVHLSLLRVSYRVVDFNVGPPLRGPELGITLRF